MSDDIERLRVGVDQTPDASALASLSDEVEALKDARSEERFIWVVSTIVLFDSYVFSQMESWSGPIVIGVIQFLLLVVLARRLGIQEVSQVLAKLLDRATEVMPGSKTGIPDPPPPILPLTEKSEVTRD